MRRRNQLPWTQPTSQTLSKVHTSFISITSFLRILTKKHKDYLCNISRGDDNALALTSGSVLTLHTLQYGEATACSFAIYFDAETPSLDKQKQGTPAGPIKAPTPKPTSPALPTPLSPSPTTGSQNPQLYLLKAADVSASLPYQVTFDPLPVTYKLAPRSYVSLSLSL